MANLSAQQATVAGFTPTYSAAAGGGDNFPCGAHTFLIARTAGTAITLTLAVPGTAWNGIANPDTAISLPATGERWILLDPRYQDTDGLAHATYTAATALTLAVVTTS
jgi:hypothetical protein